MNWVHPTFILLTAVLLAFAQSALPGFREITAVQPDLLPGLMVYAALHASLPMTLATAVLGGLATDALSAGPFGLSIVPLGAVGIFLHLRRELLLRESAWAQALLGGASAVAVAVVSLALLLVLWPLLTRPGTDPGYWPEKVGALTTSPVVGAGQLWQWLVCTVAGALGTPVLFRFFGWLESAFAYQPAPKAGYQADRDREIARGRR